MNQISDHLQRKKYRKVKSFSTIWGRSRRDYIAVLFQSVIISNDNWRIFWDVEKGVNALWDFRYCIITYLLCPIN